MITYVGVDVDAHVCSIIGAQMQVSLSSDTLALQLAVITAVCVYVSVCVKWLQAPLSLPMGSVQCVC